MTNSVADEVSLYWISGSPPAWRVMLALLLKGINYKSHLLEHSKGENKTEKYLAINPRGEVPTIVHNGVVVRESIAIMAYIDRAFPGTALFGNELQEVARIWPTVMDFESNFRPVIGVIVQILLRNQIDRRADELAAAESSVSGQLQLLDQKLGQQSWICGNNPTAADCWLYPAVAWIKRTAEVSKGNVPAFFGEPLQNFANLKQWRARFEKIEGFSSTLPPHWQKS